MVDYLGCVSFFVSVGIEASLICAEKCHNNVLVGILFCSFDNFVSRSPSVIQYVGKLSFYQGDHFS